ncbi:hemin ABC transporter substrate-binding protein [Sedimentitalea sp. XS_ASV28]|uniref:heme/hemin ABC transporter substrate-binding protein n=1 Tax=Sedimentitalea sp. XS_ASV28 TaxID=3241296 RepID=UPI003516FF28
MRWQTGHCLWAAALLAFVSGAVQAGDGNVVSAGGSITEIVYALGEQDRLIARDTTSTFPEEAQKLPNVGYVRALSPEGVLALRPGLILAEADAGPPETLDLLRDSGVPLVLIPDVPTTDGITAKIRAVGDALGATEPADQLAQQVAAQMQLVAERAAGVPEESRKRVLFVLSLQGGRILAAGQETEASSVIELAGAVNAMNGFTGYKPVSEEAVIAAAPDIILMMNRGSAGMADDAAILAVPALAATPAGKDNSLIRMDGQYLLGFGPRTAQAVTELAERIYGPTGS